MGQLQRLFMQQAAVADRWNMAKEAERKTDMKAGDSEVIPAQGASAGPGGMEVMVEANGADLDIALDAVMGNNG
jgi:hypothetical protein